MPKLILLMSLALLTACDSSIKSVFELRAEHRENKRRYVNEIRETVKECLTSVRQNPNVQNFNDDNEIVESCTDYALNLYEANDI